MPITTMTDVFDESISSHRLLDHPYYRAWEQGLLSMADLGSYAGQYRHFERRLPGVLSKIVEQLPDGKARRLVESNLADEGGRPRPHIEIFDDFAQSVGASNDAQPTEGTSAPIDLYEGSGRPVAALAVIGAYEVQAAEVALTKADSLRIQYGLGSRATEFWDLHAGLEKTHATWTVEALCHMDADPGEVRRFATESAKTWWAFLDDRELARL